MKFLMNHPSEFIKPGVAFCVGFFSFAIVAMTEFACISFLAADDDTIDVIIKQIALASIAKATIFYAAAYNESSKIKLPGVKAMERKVYREINDQVVMGKGQLKCTLYLYRFMYSFCKIVYNSLIYYLLPYLTIMLPFAVLAEE